MVSAIYALISVLLVIVSSVYMIIRRDKENEQDNKKANSSKSKLH